MRKRHDKSYWKSHLKLQQQSGLTKAEYCRQQGVNPGALYRWSQKLKMDDDGSFQRIHPVIVTTEEAPEPPKSPEPLTLFFPGGYQLSFNDSLSPESLMKYVEALSC